MALNLSALLGKKKDVIDTSALGGGIVKFGVPAFEQQDERLDQFGLPKATIRQAPAGTPRISPADTIRRQQQAVEKLNLTALTQRAAVRLPFAKEKTVQVSPADPITRLIFRTPELAVSIPVAAVNFFRKNINSIVAGKSVDTSQFKSVLGFDPKRFGIEDEVLTDTVSGMVKQAFEEEKKNPSGGNQLKATSNAIKAVSKTLVPDVLDALFGVDIAKGLLKTVVGAARVTARQLPENLLFKIQENNISPNAVYDVLIGGQRLSTAEEFKIANEFVNKLSQSERAELFRIARSYEATGASIPIKGEATPTALGKFARAEAPKAGALPPRISGLLPSGRPAGAQAGFLDVQAMGEEFASLARKAKDIAEFKGILSKEQAALLVARGFTAETFFGGVKERQAKLGEIFGKAPEGQPSDILGTKTSRAAAQREAKAFVEGLPGGGFFGGSIVTPEERTVAAARAKTKLEALRKIPPDLQSLAQEARKYKSAEEFVKAFEYHGGSKNLEGGKLSLKFDKAGGIFTTPSETTAKTWQSLRRGELYQVYLGDKKLIDLTEPKTVEKIKGLIGTKYTVDGEVSTFTKNDYDFLFPDGKADWATFSNYIPMFEKMGYKGARIAEGFNINTSLWEDIKPLDKIYSKSQLTDFYNQAVSQTKLDTIFRQAEPAPKQAQLPRQIEKTIEPPLSPMITRRARESTLLREGLREEAAAAKRGAREGARVERSAQESIQIRELEELKRKGDLKALRQRIKDRFRFVERGLREGRIEQKAVTKIVQEELDGLIKAFLPTEEQGKFLTTLKNIQTPEQLGKAIPEIKRRISDILERRETRDIKTKINKELSEKTVRRDPSGVRVGTVIPEAQRELDKISQMLKLTQEQAQNRLEEITDKLGDLLTAPDEIAEEISLLRYAAGEGDNVMAQKLLDDIQSIKETGKTLRALQVANRQAEIERLQDAFTHSITGGRGLAPGTGIAVVDLPSGEEGFIASFRKAGATAEDAALMTTFLMDKLARADTGSAYMQGPLNKWWRRVFEARNIQDASVNAAHADLKQGIQDIFKVDPDTKEFRKLLTKLLEEKRMIGTFKDTAGKEFEMKMTGSQAMYHWAQQQNPNVLPTYKETMNWTDNMIKALDGSLSEQEKQFVRFVGEGNDSFFGRFRSGEIDDIALDPIYERQFGTMLGRVEGIYIPLQRDVDIPAYIQLLQDTARNISTKPSAIKARVANKNPINLEAGLIETIENHIIQMAHYKAFSDFINQGRRVFMGDVRTSIRQNFRDASQILKILDNTFDDLAKDGVAHARNMEGLNNLRGNTAVAFVGANPVSAIKQYVSIISWAGEMPTMKFISGMVDFAISPIDKTKFLIEHSQTLKSRFEKGSLERDIAQGMRTGELSKLGKANTARQVFTILTRINDRIAILGGGWGHYIYNLERLTGKKIPTNIAKLNEFIKENPEAHKEAIRLFEEATVRTQQAGNIENQSQLQRLGSMGDLFTLFQSAPVAQFGNTLSTLRAMGFFGDAKRIPFGDGLKRLFIYLVAIPSLLQFIADGFEFKKRRQGAAIGASVATLGFSNYPLFLGELITGLGRAVAGLPTFDIGKPAPASVINEFLIAVKDNRKVLEEVTAENIFQAIKDLGVAIATLKGIPAKPAERIITGVVDVARGEGDLRQAIGFSEFALEEQGLEVRDRTQKEIGRLLELDKYSLQFQISLLDDKIKNQIRTLLKGQNDIIGSINDDSFIQTLKNMPEEERNLLIFTYAEKTQKSIRAKLGAPKAGSKRTLEDIFGTPKKKTLEEIFR